MHSLLLHLTDLSASGVDVIQRQSLGSHAPRPGFFSTTMKMVMSVGRLCPGITMLMRPFFIHFNIGDLEKQKSEAKSFSLVSLTGVMKLWNCSECHINEKKSS